MTKEQEILVMAKRIRELWPGLVKITLEVLEDMTSLDFYRLHDYNAGTTYLREFDIGDREKQSFDADRDPWCIVRGTSKEGLHVTAFCGGLPPSCHIEEYTEKIPLTETIIRDDQFIEVKRKKVVCG